MGKVKKGRGPKQIPLDVQIYESKTVKPTGRTPKFKLRQEESEYIDSKLSVKILEQARIQQEELEEEVGSGSGTKPKKTKTVKLSKDTSDSEESELEENDDYYYEDIEINEEDEKALEMFMGKDPPARITLADIIMEKITERKTELASHFSDAASVRFAEMDERVVKMYRGVGQILSKYRSGKIPKAFKIIPSLSNWEQVLYLTEPTNWTAAAMYQGTRLFASNLKEKMAQRFYNLVLLPRVRDDIVEYKKLNFHLFQALRKALYKPGAFFKGIILPLCEAGDCTLREATIFSSVIAKNSIPVLHSSAAMLKIAEMEYSGANSIFLRILLDKKYALPYRVVDAVVYHFLRFQTDKRMLPVLWHQSFLTFVQRYKEDISSEQKEALLDLLRVHYHPQITKEIRRELQHSKCREDQPTSMAVN